MRWHPSDLALQRYAGEGSGGLASAKMAVHLRWCDRCRQRVRYERSLTAALRSADANTPTPAAPTELLDQVLSDLSVGAACAPEGDTEGSPGRPVSIANARDDMHIVAGGRRPSRRRAATSFWSGLAAAAVVLGLASTATWQWYASTRSDGEPPELASVRTPSGDTSGGPATGPSGAAASAIQLLPDFPPSLDSSKADRVRRELGSRLASLCAARVPSASTRDLELSLRMSRGGETAVDVRRVSTDRVADARALAAMQDAARAGVFRPVAPVAGDSANLRILLPARLLCQ